MAFGRECPVCGATVDNNEYDYTKDMCKECAIEQEMEEKSRTDLARMMNADFKQMTLEV